MAYFSVLPGAGGSGLVSDYRYRPRPSACYSLFMRQGVILAIMSVWLLSGCTPKPSVSLGAHSSDSQTVLDVSTEGINGLLGLNMWQADTREMLWRVNLDYFRGPQLVYGHVPAGFMTINGGKNSAEQIFPAKGLRPPPLPPRRKIFVAIEAQYDEFMSASARTFYFELNTDANGRVLSVRPLTAVKPDDLPKTE